MDIAKLLEDIKSGRTDEEHEKVVMAMWGYFVVLLSRCSEVGMDDLSFQQAKSVWESLVLDLPLKERD